MHTRRMLRSSFCFSPSDCKISLLKDRFFGMLRLPSQFRTPSLVNSRLTGNNSLYLSLTETISIPKPMVLGIMAKVKRFVSYSRRVILSWPIRTPPFCLLQYRPRGYRKYMNMIYPKTAVEDILISSFRHSY